MHPRIFRRTVTPALRVYGLTVVGWLIAVAMLLAAVTAQPGAQIRGAPGPLPSKDRTTERLKALTPAQRYHSTLFPDHHDSFGNRMLDGLMSRSITFEPDWKPRKPLPAFLRDASCGTADRAVFLGSVIGAAAFPIDDGSHLFTDYTIAVVRVFKRPFGRTVKPGESVIVGRINGELEIEGVTLRATSNRAPLLRRGATYLFLAEYHRGFGVFHTKEPVFLLEGDRFVLHLPSEFSPITDPAAPIEHRRMEEVLESVASCRSSVRQP